VQHLAIFDYIAVGASLDNRVCEYVDHLHEHFVNPVRVVGGRYRAPSAPGYSAEMKAASLATYEFPHGSAWEVLASNPGHPMAEGTKLGT
jgi:L-fuconate dehydratase